MAHSLGVYVPAVIIQKALGLGRMFLFLYLMRDAVGQYNFWGLGSMILSVAAPIFSLGANQGLARYVSVHEARGQLRSFYRRTGWALAAIAILLTAGALVLSGPLAAMVVANFSQGGHATAEQVRVTQVALVNGLLLALYLNMISVMYGLRTYRLAAAVELGFGVLFTAIAMAVLWVYPTGLAALWSHLAALAVALAAGCVLLQKAVNRLADQANRGESAGEMVGPAEPILEPVLEPAMEVKLDPVVEPAVASPQIAAGAMPGLEEATSGPLRQVLAFGVVALVGTLLWNSMGYVSYWLTNRYINEETAGRFNAWLQLGQTVLLLSNAAWAVVFSHVARRWALGQQAQAMASLERSYKMLALAIMTVSVTMYATVGLWVKLLPASWQGSMGLLGGMLLFFESMTHLTILTMVARLRERPIVIAICALAGMAANVLLANWWMPTRGAMGAAMAAGVGMYLGGGAVAIVYLAVSGIKLHRGSWLLLAAPGLLALPPILSAIAWLAVLATAMTTPLILDRPEKQAMLGYLRRLLPSR